MEYLISQRVIEIIDDNSIQGYINPVINPKAPVNITSGDIEFDKNIAKAIKKVKKINKNG